MGHSGRMGERLSNIDDRSIPIRISEGSSFYCAGCQPPVNKRLRSDIGSVVGIFVSTASRCS